MPNVQNVQIEEINMNTLTEVEQAGQKAHESIQLLLWG